MKQVISFELEKDDTGSLVVTNLRNSGIPMRALISLISYFPSVTEEKSISKPKVTWTMTPEGKWRQSDVQIQT